jgi:predicted double-glycine peptidase
MMRTLLTSALALALAGLGSAPAAARERVRSLLEMRQDRVVVQKWDLSCGAAALATLLTYAHHDPASEREVALGLIGRPEYLANPELVRTSQGFSLLDLKRVAQGRGYRGLGYGQLALADLLELAPAIVPLQLAGYDHFVIFRGLRGDRVLLADPAWGNRTMPLERFEAAWLASPEFGRVAFVVARADGAPPPDRLTPRPEEFVR